MPDNINKEQYDQFFKNLRLDFGKDDVIYESGDFQCPDTGHGVAALWNETRQVLWYEICRSGIWVVPEEEIDTDTYRWCVKKGITPCDSIETAADLAWDAADEPVDFH